jgi:hypothetical protein
MRRVLASLLTTGLAVCAAGIASADSPTAPRGGPPSGAAGSLYDLSQLPAVSGTVAHYTLTPRGDVDGLVLTDGTEVRFPPHLSTQLVFAVKLGDAVTVHGLKAYSIPLIAAVAITDNSANITIVDDGPSGPGKAAGEAQAMKAEGRVEAALHGPRGELNGAMLDDGTVLRLAPPEAQRVASMLVPGQSIEAEGRGLATPLGKVIEVTAIGSPGTPPTEVAPPPPPPNGPKKGPKPPRP